MGDVSVHYNSRRPAQIGALAYTQGSDIHIGPGQERHLPHESWHVVQQKQGRVRPTLQAKGLEINDERGLEREADVMGEKAARLGESLGVTASPPLRAGVGAGVGVGVGVGVQRKVIQRETDGTTPHDPPEVEEAPVVSAELLVEDLFQREAKDRPALVLGLMELRDDFIPALAETAEGKALLESMVKNSISCKIPDMAHVLNILTPTGSGPEGLQKGLGLFPGVPIALVFGTVSAAMRYIGMGFALRRKSHRNWIKKLLAQEFQLRVSGWWSEVALRKTYLTFHTLPEGTVRGVVDEINRSSGFGSSAAGQKIYMGSLLPTAPTMGSVEPLIRLGRGRFLKNDSKYSARMKWKNAWSMTLLHEVGHTVDHKRQVMDNHGARPVFGGWQTMKATEVADSMLDAYMEGHVHFSDEEKAEIGRLEEVERREDALFAKHWPSGTSHREKLDYYNQTGKAAGERAREASSQRRAIVDEVHDRAWTARHRVTREMLKRGITAAATKRGYTSMGTTTYIYNAVRGAPGFDALSAPEKAQTLRTVTRHPAVRMVRKNYGLGAWERNDETMAKMARPFGGRYFQRSYPGSGNKADRKSNAEWVSFEVDSRRDAVSHYQYRAPGEWFAELYAHYYMGTLEGHPLYRWFAREIDVDYSPDLVLGGPTDEDLAPDEA